MQTTNGGLIRDDTNSIYLAIIIISPGVDTIEPDLNGCVVEMVVLLDHMLLV